MAGEEGARRRERAGPGQRDVPVGCGFARGQGGVATACVEAGEGPTSAARRMGGPDQGCGGVVAVEAGGENPAA